MTEEMRIKVRLALSSIWVAADPEDLGLDQFESEQRLCQNIENCVYEQYPDAEISVMTDVRDYVNVDGEDSFSEDSYLSRIVHHCNLIVDKCWQGDWQQFARDE